MTIAKQICIIGGGFCGTMVAAGLRRSGFQGTIAIVEKESARVARGVAYSPPNAKLMLNVPAKNMGAWADNPGHFLEWLNARAETPAPTAYLSRQLFGEYLRAVLHECETKSGKPVDRFNAEAVGASFQDGTWNVTLSDGRAVVAHTVVIAIGNLRPGPPKAFAAFEKSLWWRGNPWSPDAHARCRDGERVLVIGSGLTMIDVCLSLASGGARPRITALSRHGLLPCIHDASDPASATPPPAGCSLREAFRHVRSEARRLLRDTGNWRPSIDCLRPHTPAIWSSFSHEDQALFLRHLRTYWDVHRHRVPAEVVGRIVELRQARVLKLVGARVAQVQDLGQTACVSWCDRYSGSCVTSNFDRVINCTGARTNIEASTLLGSIAAAGEIRAEHNGLGLLTDNTGRAINTNGVANDSLLVLGPLRRGTLWESSAVPELRNQAADVVRMIMSGVSH